jgi:transcription termination factor Rho
MRDGQSRRRDGRPGPRRPDHRKPHHAPKAAYRPAAPQHRPQEPRPEREDSVPTALGPVVEGVLELHPKGYGFLRSAARSYTPQPSDPYVAQPLIQRLNLREGLLLAGPVDASRQGTGPRIARVERIEGKSPDEFKHRNFDDLTAIDPHEHITLETGAEPLTTRVMDLLTPIGKGQRGLIVAPPRTGKTILLQHIAQAVVKNHPEMQLFMLLVDERPEEVTEMRRTIQGEVVASSSDRDTVSHIRLAELVVERAKRLAEQGKQVFVLIDSLTRLSRAYNKSVGNSGRTMSGGIDSRAMEVPRRLFGSARVFEEGGSLTVIATALIDTGSRMDDYIFQEFKGTGNMELVLDRKLADRRIYPAIDFTQSGTRKEERILSAETLKRTTLLRRSMVQMKPVEAMESLVGQLGKYPSNAAFLDRVATFIKE